MHTKILENPKATKTLAYFFGYSHENAYLCARITLKAFKSINVKRIRYGFENRCAGQASARHP